MRRCAAPSKGDETGLRAWRGRRPGFVLAALLLLATPLAAQRLPFTSYTAADGLPGSQIWDVHQDRRGLIWLAATWGFSRFDGERFVTLSTGDGLPSPNARCILEAPNGDLWFGTGLGLARFDGRTIQSFAGVANAPHSNIWAATADAAGRLWFGTEQGLVRYDGADFKTYRQADGLAGDYVYSLLAARDGALWIGSRGAGLTRCRLDDRGEPAACRVWRAGDGIGSDVVRALAEDPDGRVLVGTRGGGLAIWDGNSFGRRTIADGLPSNDIYALLVESGGRIAIGTAADGLAICLGLDPLRCRLLSERNGLPENGVRTLFEDREGALWIGTEAGLAQLSRDEVWNYAEPEGLPDEQIYALAPSGRDGLWVGTFGGLVEIHFGAHGMPSLRLFGPAQGLPAKWVWSLAPDAYGALWVGTEGGLCRLAGERCERAAGTEAVASAYVVSLLDDPAGPLWVGTTDGVARLDRDRAGNVVGSRLYRRADGLAGARAYAMALDGAKRLWVAHADGLSRFDGERFAAVGAAEGLPWKTVRGLGVDRQGRLLLGGYGAVARVEPGASGEIRFRRWERAPGLEDRVVLTLAEDASGRFLLGTSRGVVILDPEARGGSGAIVARLDSSTGAAGTEISHSSAFAIDGMGRYAFGFKGGLTVLPGGWAKPPAAPPVEFSRLESERGRTFLSPFSGPEHGPVGWLGAAPPEFPHEDRSLRAAVRATSFTRRNDLRFQFRLEGRDADWSEPRPEPFRDLMNLTPGTYRLLARAAHVDGPWGEPAAITFELQAAWWQSRWFLAGALAAVALTGIGGVRWRVATERQRTRELERRIAERTDDLTRYASALADHLQNVDRTNEQARRAEALRRELFARTSHELRTPLTAILGFSELLERSLADRLDDKERRYLSNVRESGEWLLREINELLEHLKLEAGRIEVQLDDVELDTMISSVSLMEGFALHRGVRLDVKREGELPTVRADAAKLRQVLTNLVSNAIKFSPSGSAVEVVARPLDESRSGWGQAGYELEVRDQGPGIAAADLASIFEPYRRLSADESVPGTGLGLPIVRQFVELLGGTVEVDSAPGRGSTFRVRLPVDPDPQRVLLDRVESGEFELKRAQAVVLDPDHERFAELTRGFPGESVLLVRVDGVDSLRTMLANLRPNAAVLSVDLDADGRQDLLPALREVSAQRLPLVILVRRGERALALPFAGALDPRADETAVRRALRAARLPARAAGRRHLALIAAARETGITLGGAFAAAGCDHFRVDGVEEARSALVEASPDVVAIDFRHVVGFGAEAAASAEGSRLEPAWILIVEGEPGAGTRELLDERLRTDGGDAATQLARALGRFLDLPAATGRRGDAAL
jgi:signal transduction histidine kinase/ligand-binding sensor domain-containing protein